ncbi:MAG: PilZ domain-containing protein [Gammaproteobacteria bacterium]|nr:PilZ domain-containing protein [Gammaproteobacteria bacterium]
MGSSSTGETKLIESQQEITELLNLAKEFQWKLSFGLPEEPIQPGNVTEIYHVNDKEGHVTVGSEVNSLCPADDSAILFIARDAGISVEFESRTLPYAPGNPLAYSFASDRRIAFPDKLVYTQARQSERVNISSLQAVPVTLGIDGNNQLSGTMFDISEHGTRLQFPGYFDEQVEETDIFADCVLDLPAGDSVQCKVEVLGSSFNFDDDASFVRCRFVDMSHKNQANINEFIDLAKKQKFLEKSA